MHEWEYTLSLEFEHLHYPLPFGSYFCWGYAIARVRTLERDETRQSEMHTSGQDRVKCISGQDRVKCIQVGKTVNLLTKSFRSDVLSNP